MTQPNVTVPVEYVQDGRIVLNIASRATGNLALIMILLIFMRDLAVFRKNYGCQCKR